MSDDRHQPDDRDHNRTDLGDTVSVVLPVFNESQNLAPLLAEIADALASIPYEIVAVDDGSDDGSLDVLLDLRAAFPTLRIVPMPRRSGQSAALLTGFDAARGSVIVTLDADGQNDPRDIPRLLALRGGLDDARAVVGVRFGRAVGRWKRVQARVANTVRDIITGDKVRDTGCGLRVARRVDLRKLPRFTGLHRFIPTLLRREGVMVLEVPVNDRPRRHGVSKYGMWNRALVGLIDACGVRWLMRRALPGAPGPPNESGGS